MDPISAEPPSYLPPSAKRGHKQSDVGAWKLILQITAGILLAGAISTVFWMLWAHWAAMQAAQDIQDQIAAMTRQQQAFAAQRAQAEKRRAQADEQRAFQRELELRLKPGEACLGAVAGAAGTVVVRNVVNGVPQAVQLLEYGRPVKCVGDHRVQ